MSKVKSYEVMIPVFKKGSDLQTCMLSTGKDYDAFKLQASYYELASEVCKRMASFLYENPEVKIDMAMEHIVRISGNEEQCASLLKDEVLYDDDAPEEESLDVEKAYTSYPPSFKESYSYFEDVCLNIRQSLDEGCQSIVETECTSPLSTYLTRINNLKL